MERGKIRLAPGSEGAPWDLELDGDQSLAGAMFVLQPAGDSGYRVLATRLEAPAGVAPEYSEFDFYGLTANHIQTVLS